MSPRSAPIAQAWLEKPESGVIELARDWMGRTRPPVYLGSPPRPFKVLRPIAPLEFAADSGYFVGHRQQLWFVLPPEKIPWVDVAKTAVYVAGDFNGWGAAVGQAEWQLKLEEIDGRSLLVLRRKADGLLATPPKRFKFVTGEHHWIEVPFDAPNLVRDEQGNANHALDPERTGHHRFHFETELPLDLSENLFVLWRDAEGEFRAPLRPDGFFFEMKSALRLGATVEGDETVFRLFAPRARRVRLKLLEKLEEPAGATFFPLSRVGDGVWELRLDRNLHGWFYWYHVEGPANVYGFFDRQFPVLDPYAKAVVDRVGPGIVLDDAFFARPKDEFKTPAWQDLVIAEAHVRDLVGQAPLRMSDEERRGFSGLAKWIAHPDFYLKRLGVNCVELQPVTETDNRTREEYFWGYMPVNWFAPESGLSLNPAKASGVRELQDVVRAFHKQGIAVILDVVFNHVGEPAHLMLIDKHYYFDDGGDGSLTNWSGCGNDIRADSAMVRQIIVDSCTHLIRAFGVDGFRFDLAELIGVEPLKKIEAALKLVKPDVILIAEPWSFRGHIAGALAETGWASWNDGYRKFLPGYVRGEGSRESFEYFFKGSPWYFARWPAQTVNYASSHDDSTWIDVITENGDGNGFWPTVNDRRRTHLMGAILFASIGIPLLASGVDFLHSKHGVNNTYLRGDLNALDYRRIFRFPGSHRYFADWIRFRLSEQGKLLRLYSRPGEGFFQFIWAEGCSGVAVVFNADGELGRQRLLFAINPHQHEIAVGTGAFPKCRWRQLADHEHFFAPGVPEASFPFENELILPPLGCGLWVGE